MYNPIIRGWINYYCCFCKSGLYAALDHLNRALIRWVQRKFKKLRTHTHRAAHWLDRIARREPVLLGHLENGDISGGWMTGAVESRVHVRF